MLRNLVHGTIVSGKLWPLLFDTADRPHIRCRSIPFFRQLVREPALLTSLDDEQRCFLLVGVRDLWLAHSLGGLKEAEQEPQLLQEVLALIDDDWFPTAELRSMPFSLCPTKNRRVLKFVEHLEEVLGLDADVVECAAQLVFDTPGATSQTTYAVWVDARDLSYHNFECILPLDRVLQRPPGLHVPQPSGVAATVTESKRKTRASTRNSPAISSPVPVTVTPADLTGSSLLAPLQLQVTDLKRVHSKLLVFVGRVTGSDVGVLQQLDKLGLYQQPSNSATRGGERFVFSSSALSSGLSNALRSSGFLDMLPKPRKPAAKEKPKYSWPKEKPKKKKDPFVAVNSVFRCNRFAPGDSRFELHMDTPYYDASRGHVSQYTIIIYMTAGDGRPALRIGGGADGKSGPAVQLDHIEEMQCVIFDQRLEHEGSSYLNSTKVFLRSELLFAVKPAEHKPEIGALFSSAVYFTTQSVFQPEFARHAHDLYERVNRAHWGIAGASPAKEPQMLHKCWEDSVHFATNGFDYFFPYLEEGREDPLLALKTFALIAVLDHFNCRFETTDHEERLSKKKKPRTPTTGSSWAAVFRQKCATKAIFPPANAKSAAEWVLPYLWNELKASASKPRQDSGMYPIEKTEKQRWLNAAVDEKPFHWDGENETCCPFHCFDDPEDNLDEEDIRLPFRPWTCRDVISLYTKARQYASRQLMGAPLILLDKEFRVDVDNIIVADSKIFINSANPQAQPFRINFAACWNVSTPEAWIDVAAKVAAPRFLLPPISFVAYPSVESSGPGFRFMLDFFHNDWAMPVVNLERDIPVPTYMTDVNNEARYDDDAPTPFLDAVGGINFHAPESDVSGDESDGEQ